MARLAGLPVLALCMLIAACSPSAPAPPTAPAGSGQRHFTGTWNAAGTRQALDLGPGHRAEVFSLSGSLMLSGEARPHLGFRAEVIGFADSQSGMQGRSVWTDERGEKAFSELHSAGVPGQLVEGRFVGGTGRYAGVSGEYTFKWQPLVATEDGGVSGRVVELRGWARLATPSAGPLPGGSPP